MTGLPLATVWGNLNLERVDVGDVMHDHADRASVVRYAHLPLCVSEAGGEGHEGAGAFFETIGQRIRLTVGGARWGFGVK